MRGNRLMHPTDTMIVISIACMVGITPVLYVNKDVALAVGYLVGSTIGAFTGAYLALWYFPLSDKAGILIGGLAGALLMVAAWHLVRRDYDRQ